jgi:hypothetical protein
MTFVSGFIVCAPADGDLMVVGTTLRHFCSRCKQRVMMSPSGQQHLKSLADIQILCLNCYGQNPPLDAKHILSAGSLEGLAAELATVIPNTFKNRN